MARHKNGAIEISPMPLERFVYDKLAKTLIAESSDFGPLREGLWWLQRLYNDAADLGIAIRSQKSGRVVRFVLFEEMKRNGEFVGWKFRPEDGKEQSAVVEVTILND